jgi:hypothetical protein
MSSTVLQNLVHIVVSLSMAMSNIRIHPAGPKYRDFAKNVLIKPTNQRHGQGTGGFWATL